ncbi:MAG TPA: YetF domain-containing protein [Anaerolineae bacterium]
MMETLASLAPVLWHTVVIYIFLILVLGLLGHRQTSELGLVELVIIMMLGSAVETAMVAGDTSLPAGLLSAATLLVLNRIFAAFLSRFPRVRRVIVGHPIPLVYHGQYLPHRMREAGLTEADVLEGIRERGYEHLKEVRFAVLELDGTISVVPASG